MHSTDSVSYCIFAYGFVGSETGSCLRLNYQSDVGDVLGLFGLFDSVEVPGSKVGFFFMVFGELQPVFAFKVDMCVIDEEFRVLSAGHLAGCARGTCESCLCSVVWDFDGSKGLQLKRLNEV
ncbi:hypothetical protein Droror1_Dr00020348 [Drosera rotundifolia]